MWNKLSYLHIYTYVCIHHFRKASNIQIKSIPMPWVSLQAQSPSSNPYGSYIYYFIYWLLHIFADPVALVFMMLRNSCFLGCFMLFPPLPRPRLIPPMATGCLGCGPQWPPKISCPGWHPRRHSHQETSENLRSKFFDVVHGGTSWHLYGNGTYITIYHILLQTMFFVSVYYLIIYPKRTFSWGCTANIYSNSLYIWK